MRFASDDEFLAEAPRGDEFLSAYAPAVAFLDDAANSGERVQVISHLDADGLSSAAIMLETLRRRGIESDLRVVHNIDDAEAQKIAALGASRYAFVDIGSGQLAELRDAITAPSLILDHHEPSAEALDSMVHINPLLYDQDGNTGISGAGTTYLLARALGHRDLARLAIVGAIGDIQERDGFSGFNRLLLSDALGAGVLAAERGVRLFGAQTRPLTKLLAYNHDLQLDGITGDPDAAYRFLVSLGIRIRHSRGERRYIDLDDEERMRLLSGILIKRSGLENPEAILGYNYTLTDELEGTPFRDAREFATLLNACGRMDAASIGVGAAMGLSEQKEAALRVEREYKREIGRAIGWFKEQLVIEDRVECGPGYYLVDGRDEVRAEIIGTLASIASHMDELSGPALICSYAYLATGDLKVSLRSHGEVRCDLREVMASIAEAAGGSAGGHANAAGALVPKDHEASFVTIARERLSTITSEF